MEVARQQVHGLRRNSGWTWFWMARRVGSVDWHEASAPAEAIRRAILLRQAAGTAEQAVLADSGPDDEPATDGDSQG